MLADSHLLSIESPKSAILISNELVSRMFSGCNHKSRRESNKDFFIGSSLWDGRAGSHHQNVGSVGAAVQEVMYPQTQVGASTLDVHTTGSGSCSPYYPDGLVPSGHRRAYPTLFTHLYVPMNEPSKMDGIKGGQEGLQDQWDNDFLPHATSVFAHERVHVTLRT